MHSSPMGAERTEAEQKIGAAWRAVLGVDSLSLDDNIFNLGGTSIHVVQAYSKLRDSLGVPLTVLDLFSHPTIRSLVAHLFPLTGTQNNFQPAAARAALQWRASAGAARKTSQKLTAKGDGAQ